MSPAQAVVTLMLVVGGLCLYLGFLVGRTIGVSQARREAAWGWRREMLRSSGGGNDRER